MKLEYCRVVQNSSGVAKTINEQGEDAVLANEDILVTLNKRGEEGWEVVCGVPNSDSTGITYLLKRAKRSDGKPHKGLLGHYEREAER